MKTQIRITGQVAGNNRLHLHLQENAEKVERFFQDFILIFHTKKEAKKALWTAYKNLKELEPDFYRDGGISYFKGIQLIYDASSAIIVEL
jgi:acyl-ACP thioesterase